MKSSRGSTRETIARSDLLEEAGDVDGAIRLLSEAIRSAPDEPWLLARRGRLFKIQNEWRRAIEDFDAALALKPDAPTTLFFRAKCRALLGDFDGAIADFEGCIRLQPSSADAYFEIGAIHGYRGNVSGKLAAIEKAYELDPDHYPGIPDVVARLRRRLEGNAVDVDDADECDQDASNRDE